MHVENDTLPQLRNMIAEQSKGEDFQTVVQGTVNKSDGMVIAKREGLSE